MVVVPYSINDPSFINNPSLRAAGALTLRHEITPRRLPVSVFAREVYVSNSAPFIEFRGNVDMLASKVFGGILSEDVVGRARRHATVQMVFQEEVHGYSDGQLMRGRRQAGW